MSQIGCELEIDMNDILYHDQLHITRIVIHM